MAGKLMQLPVEIMKIAKPKVSTFMYYAKTELRPPTLSEIPEVTKGFARILTGYKNGAWKQMTIREGFLNILVATEVFCWFYIGECIGKRHIVGYKLD